MKWSLLAAHSLAVRSAFGLVNRQVDNHCWSLYGDKRVHPIPTVTTTVTYTTDATVYKTDGTSILTFTIYPTEISATSTVTDTVTNVVTVAPSTTIVPTNPSFTPVASAETTNNPNNKRKRSSHPRSRPRPYRRSRKQLQNAPPHLAARMAQTGSYVTEVDCVSTKLVIGPTITDLITLLEASHVHVNTPKTVYTYVTEATTTTSTLATSVATQYQGCQLASNRLSAISGVPVAMLYEDSNTVTPLGRDFPVPDYGPSGLLQTGFSHTGDQGAIESASGCCNAAFAASCSGWAFEYDPEGVSRRTCNCLPYNPADGRGWMFVAGGITSGTYVVGNGPSGVPINWGFYSYS